MKQRETLLIAISIFITIIAWVGFNVYHASVTSTVSEALQKQIEPIEGKFDTELIEALKRRDKVLPISNVSRKEATEAAQIKQSKTQEPPAQPVIPTPAVTESSSEQQPINENPSRPVGGGQ